MWNYRPRHGGHGDFEVTVKWLDLWIEIFEQQVWRNDLVFQGERGLNEPREASCAFCVSNHSFDGANVKFFGNGVWITRSP